MNTLLRTLTLTIIVALVSGCGGPELQLKDKSGPGETVYQIGGDVERTFYVAGFAPAKGNADVWSTRMQLGYIDEAAYETFKKEHVPTRTDTHQFLNANMKQAALVATDEAVIKKLRKMNFDTATTPVVPVKCRGKSLTFVRGTNKAGQAMLDPSKTFPDIILAEEISY